MPTYEYRCRSCDAVFELDRPMRDSSAPARCPNGHIKSMRVLSAFAALSASGGGPSPAPMAPAPSSAMGCGGACACH